MTTLTHTTTDSPIGPLRLYASARGLTRIAFDGEAGDEGLAPSDGGAPQDDAAATAVLDAARRELTEYFEGRRSRFDVPVDLTLPAGGFRRRVLEAAIEIPYGSTATYRELATEVCTPRAVRATGAALGANPIPIVIPCHRVLRTDGGLGGYRGGLDAKRLLLDLEGAAA
jgi:methylated-DNA-[protein]-cysteine S-methyltransferase